MTRYQLARSRTCSGQSYERGTPVTVHTMDHDAGTAQVQVNCPDGPDAEFTVRIADLLTPDQVLCQQMAELHYQVACSENHDIAWFRSPVYANQKAALHALIKVAWGLPDEQADEVLNTLSYGPDESLQGTEGTGIASFAQYVRENFGTEGYRLY